MEETESQDIISGLNCKIWVQFEKHEDFFNALKVLCGRSMQKQGSRLRVDYDVTWDREGHFQSLQRKNLTKQAQEMGSQMLPLGRDFKHEAPRLQSQVTLLGADGARSKRFRD